jgi:hypothetical protein
MGPGTSNMPTPPFCLLKEAIRDEENQILVFEAYLVVPLLHLDSRSSQLIRFTV